MGEDQIELQEQFWKKVNGEELSDLLKGIAESRSLHARTLAFVCIGTDRSSGDALGPLVGSKLAELGYAHVIGTLAAPCDASNLAERLAEIPPNAVVIAIDACLGQKLSVGKYQLSNQPLAPGKSVGKVLPPIGDYTIAAIVNMDGPRQYQVLQTTSLYQVMRMAEEVTKAIVHAFPI
ncbi:spore protease YyaC [Paenibacillus roseipurpureus]|uniref:Spore protease YyaC n=1 Tax=Paenibacillus roseopurpureus TaxID=2918901 RepID=A0AA96LRE1_9BACL|nr:spore protease YyaC [Paenibacillus sp. MBLB1832]WNR45176.1 spore protease YyaC [Paenibacillus sp. MBLB1832]